MNDQHILGAIAPVIVILFLGMAAAIGSRALRLNPIVGYLVLGLGLRATGTEIFAESQAVDMLAELGVVFLLFDIGLHFSLQHLREQAADMFVFGPVQVLFGGAVLAALGWGAGLAPLPAVLVGATLALSSTAVVARVIAERHQQNCPVGLTATAILVFQDVAAILLLVVAGALSGGQGGLAAAIGSALARAVAAFAVAFLLARVVVRPLFSAIARSQLEEVYTAIALLAALGAGWATGQVGLSLTLGAFLGGMIIAETPYRTYIQSEIKPFRGLLLGFFFIAVGFGLDPLVLARSWPLVVALTAVLFAVKAATNAAASLVFRWSVPGSAQLGFLLAQGSEFAFVIFSLPALRATVGEARLSVLEASVALSLALTPTVAALGRTLAGRMRAHGRARQDLELTPRGGEAPVVIVGMGRVGRTLADALEAFDIGYFGIERDQARLRAAVADGYAVAFGDLADPRLWEPVMLQGRRVTALTAPVFETAQEVTPLARSRYPGLRRFASVPDEAEAARFRSIGVEAVVDRSVPPGLDFASTILRELGVEDAALEAWMRRMQARALGDEGAVLAPA